MHSDLQLSSYHYHLPEHLIAQHPADQRDNSRLMVLNRKESSLDHKRFSDLTGLIDERDMLVINTTKVFPARLLGHKETGGKVELFLLEFPTVLENDSSTAKATALIKSSKRPKPGSFISMSNRLGCRVLEILQDGKALLEITFDPHRGLHGCLEEIGQVPLPPYINRTKGSSREDAERYQTVYAAETGAVAAPTAGLHFTKELLKKITGQGTAIGEVVLHVGYGTFAPVRQQDITLHQIHREYLTIPETTVEMVEQTKQQGGRVWAVGTTSVRALEYGAKKTGKLQPVEEWCDLYIYPGFEFKVVDNLITNFHLPDSSLMFLVSALCGRQTLLDCYNEAVNEEYRFFSYGDAMAIVGG